jgi:hypothetical protein
VVRRSKPVRVALATAGLVLAFGLLVWLVFWLRPLQPAVLVLAGAGYQHDLSVPHNAYGMNGLRALKRRAEAAGAATAGRLGFGLRLARPDPVVLTRALQLYDEIDRSGGRTAVVYLALHGAADARGPFLILGRERPGAAYEKLYVATLLDHLRERGPKRFVLALDATQAPALPYLGVLHNDFARALRDLAPEIRRATNVVVLSASDVGQRSWVSDRWRTSVFAHALAEAITAAPAGTAGRWVTVEDLWGDVRAKVERWALDHRGELQSPVLLPDPSESGRPRSFELALAPERTPSGAGGSVSGVSGNEPIPGRWRKAWDEAWQAHAGLAPAGQEPAVVTPLRWRRYRDQLVRFDQLVRADDDEAGAAGAALNALRAQVAAGRTFPLASARNSLAMPAAEGPAPPDPAGARAEFNTLWFGTATAEALDLGRQPEKRWRFAELLYGRAAADPSPEALATSARLLGDVATTGAPLAAELLLLAAIARAGPADPVDPAAYRDVVGRALAVRSQAERAAVGALAGGPSYSADVAPWVAPVVREADRLRRRAEDLVFANGRESWAEAVKAFEQADGLYRSAEAVAGDVREARLVCDRALADLPYFADWAAGLPDTDPGREPAGAVRDLLGRAHELAELLDVGSRPEGTADGRPFRRIKELAGAVGDGLDRLRGDFERSCDEAGRDYRALASAAETPLPAPEAREKMLRRLVELSPETASRVPLTATERKDAADRAADAALSAGRVRGALAMAVLGSDWFDEAAEFAGGGPEAGDQSAASDEETDAGRAEPLESFDRVESLLSARQGDPGAVARAGRQIGERWRRMPRALARWVRAADAAEPGAVPADLGRADRLARRLPSGVEALDDPRRADDRSTPDVDAPRAHRARLLQALLLEQARRALADHWFDGEGRPYYKEAGGRFLDDVRALDGRAEDRGGAAALRKALARDDRLEVTGPVPLDLTTERAVGLDFGLRIPAGSLVPEGSPVVWLEPGPSALFAVEQSSAGRHRREVRPPADGPGDAAGLIPPSARFRARLGLPMTARVEAGPDDLPRPEPAKSAVVLNGVYRGQSLRRAVPVTFHPVPDVAAVQYPLPDRGRVAVSADDALVTRYGEGGGALAIVLDCSGSMATVTARARDGTAALTKYKEATEALRQVLGRVSRGTVVSLWVFGQAMPPNNAAEAERTIAHVLEPRVWDPQETGLIDDVMRRVEPPNLRPWNESPVVRTMLLARGDLERSGAGYKSLLVLTDGKDNRFAKDAEVNPEKKDIPTALRDAFVDSDVEIIVVGYKLSDADEVEAREQFKVIEGLPRPGRFFAVREAGRLASALARALRPSLRATVETLGNVPVASLSVGRAGGNPRWSEPALAPGGYKLVARAGVRRERELVVNRGDLLLARIAERPGGGVAIERELWSGDAEPNDRERVTGWRFSVVRNARAGQNRDRLELWSTLEKFPSARESALEMVKPREFWTEVVPGNAATAASYAQRWAYQPGLPAPCWALRVPSWPSAEGDPTPATARPTVRVWWDPDQEASYTTAVVRLADYASTDEIPAREVRAEGASVAIEGVTVEDRRVEVAPGEWRERSCLVVRLRHEPGKPFEARLLGLQPEGAEHRFYTAANKYTGIFWNVTRDQAGVALDGLGLVSVAGLKARAERRGYTAEWRSPGAPDPRATGPDLVPFDDAGRAPEPLPGDAVLAR